MSTISLSLDFLWNLLKPILSDAVKERLKPKDSAAKAKERIFKLYKVLGQVQDRTDDFVEKLRAYIKDVESGELAASVGEFRRSPRVKDALSRGEIVPPPENSETSLKKVALALMKDMDELVQSLDRVNPQLEIYESDIVRDILGYRNARLQIIYRGLEMPTDVQHLRPLLLRAEGNRLLINGAIGKTRSFIKTEFSFKESF